MYITNKLGGIYRSNAYNPESYTAKQSINFSIPTNNYSKVTQNTSHIIEHYDQPTTKDPTIESKGVEVPINDVAVFNDANIIDSIYKKFENPNNSINPLVDITVDHAPNSPAVYNIGGNVHINVSYDKDVECPNYSRNIMKIANKGALDVMMKFITDERFIVSNYELSQANELSGVPGYIVKPKNDISLVTILENMEKENNNTLGWNLNYNRDLNETIVTRICSFYLNKMNSLIHYIITNNVTKANDEVRKRVKEMFQDNSGNIYSFAHFTLVLPALVNYFAKQSINGIDNHALKYVGYIQKDSRLLPAIKGNYQDETKHVELTTDSKMKFNENRADYMFKQGEEYLMKTGQYNYPLSAEEKAKSWNVNTVKDVPDTTNILSGIDVPYIAKIAEDKLKYKKENNDFIVITRDHIKNLPTKKIEKAYRRLQDDCIKIVKPYSGSQINVESNTPGKTWTEKCNCKTQEVWDGKNRFGCTPLNRKGTPKSAMSGVRGKCTYENETKCEDCTREVKAVSCPVTITDPYTNMNSGGVTTTFNEDDDTISINIEKGCTDNKKHTKTLEVKRRFEYEKKPNDNPAYFIGFCEDEKTCGPGVKGAIALGQTAEFIRKGNGGVGDPIGVNEYNPKGSWKLKPHVAYDNNKIYGEFNPEGSNIEADNDEVNFKDHRFLVTYSIKNDILYFNDNVFKGWLDLVTSKPALQTIVNDIRKLAFDNPSLVVLCNVFNHTRKFVHEKFTNSTCFVELPLGPPLLSVGSDFMFDNKYIYGCAAKEVIDGKYGKFQEGDFTPLITKYIVNESVTGYMKSSYLDIVYHHLYKACTLPELNISNPKERKTALCITIPSSGTQIFDLISNKNEAKQNQNIVDGQSDYVSYKTWEELSKVEGKSLLVIFFSNPEDSDGKMLTGKFDKVGSGEYNVSMFNISYGDKVTIDIDTRNGAKSTNNNKIWLYTTKVGKDVFYKCSTGTSPHGARSHNWVQFDYFGPDLTSLPAFLRTRKYQDD